MKGIWPLPQTRRQSAIETAVNIGIGYFVSMALNLYFLPHYSKEIGDQNLIIAIFIGGVFTIVSVIRSFSLRRLFNKWHEVKA